MPFFVDLCQAPPDKGGMETTNRVRALIYTSDGDTFRATGRDPVDAVRAAAREAGKTPTGGQVGTDILTASDVRFVTHREEYPS